jgi:hypothetical protein
MIETFWSGFLGLNIGIYLGIGAWDFLISLWVVWLKGF